MAEFIVPMGLVLALLAGCGSSGSSNVQDDRQFASNAKTAPAEETTPTATAAAPTATSGAPSGSTQPVNPLATRGAPNEAFTWDDSTITIFSMTGTSPSLVTIEGTGADGALIRDVAASPSGDRLAVLTSDTLWSPESLRISLYSRDGRQLAPPRPLSAVEATPVASPGSAASPVATPATPVRTEAGDGTGARLLVPPSSLTWSPSGDQVVATVAGSAVVILSVADTTLKRTDAIAIPDAAGTVVGAWMSPRQDRVLLVLDAGSGGNAIATISLTGTDRRPHVVWPGTDERRTKSVRQVAWMPDGTGLVFTAVQKGTTGSGNLYEVPLSTLEPRVLATPGRAGPSARVGTFALSPDGKSIAYTLETPNGSDWTFHSLWVRSVRSGTAIEVSSANGSTVSTPVWTSEGLVWEQSPADGAQADLVVAREDGSSAVIASRNESGWHRAGAQGATPVASPGASPAASPIASPSADGATPLASPEASPNG